MLVIVTNIIATIVAFYYASLLTLKCIDEVRGKECANSFGKSICSQNFIPVIALGMSLFILIIMSLGCTYKGFFLGIVVAILFEVINIVPMWVNDDQDFLTKR